jgi:hypothetical protein
VVLLCGAKEGGKKKKKKKESKRESRLLQVLLCCVECCLLEEGTKQSRDDNTKRKTKVFAELSKTKNNTTHLPHTTHASKYEEKRKNPVLS